MFKINSGGKSVLRHGTKQCHLGTPGYHEVSTHIRYAAHTHLVVRPHACRNVERTLQKLDQCRCEICRAAPHPVQKLLLVQLLLRHRRYGRTPFCRHIGDLRAEVGNSLLMEHHKGGIRGRAILHEQPL